MRNAPGTRQPTKQKVIAHLRAPEDAGDLVCEPLPLDGIEVEYGGMSGKARKHGWSPTVIRPIDEACQRAPVHFLLQSLGARLGAGHDQPIEVTCPQLIDRLVVIRYVSFAAVRASQLRK